MAAHTIAQARAMHPPSPELPAPSLQALRRSQRRLFLAGGGVITVLVVLTAIISILSGVSDFHARERQKFFEAKGAVDYFLIQRDRAYAASINASDAMWADQRDELRRLGRPMVAEYHANGMRVLVRAEGRTSVPWLVLGDPAQPMATADLEAYLGLMYQYSLYTAAAVSALQGAGPAHVYGYEPKGRLLALPGVIDEAQLLQRLRVTSRAQAFSRLMAVQAQVQLATPHAGPLESAVQSHRLVSFFGRNPLDGQPSLVGLATLAQGGTPYFRRVAFEPVSRIAARLDATAAGSYLLTRSNGEVVLAKGGAAHATPGGGQPWAHPEHGGLAGEASSAPFEVGAALQGLDARLSHPYGWAALWQDQGLPIALHALAGTLIVVVLWTLLWRMDRRIMTPVLAEASRVYESEALSQTIIGTASVGLALLRCEDGAPLLQNQVARALAESPAGSEAVPPLYAALIQHARSLNGTNGTFTWALQRDNQAPIQLEVALAHARYREQEVWVCALHDITAQVELQDTLDRARRDSEQARAAAEAANRAKTAFVATMSHEIRTPLNGVLGHLELLARSTLQPAQSERLQRIRHSADSLMAIISDVLDFSKIEAGQLDIDPVRFNVRELVEQAALLYVPQAHKKGVKLFYGVDPGLDDDYRADAHRIRQIINNLLSNAVKFTESGRITLQAGVGEGALPGQVLLRLRVIDSGVGIADAQLGQLFRPFEQGDASVSRRYGGSGLGLALCRQLAQLLGGSIHAESTLGVGSVFTLDVPVALETGSAPLTYPLSGKAVTLLSAAPEWRQEIGHLLQRWGAALTVIDRPAALPADALPGTLLIVGERRAWSTEDELALCQAHARLVRAYPSGPLAPEARADGTHVTSYSSPALLRALQLRSDGGAAPAATSAAPAQAGHVMRGSVLLVEDNPVNRELIQQQLEELGCHVDTAENGQAALSLWRPGAWDVVLTDINMPVMDGYQLAQAIRSRGETLPVLAVTATALSSERERCRAVGIDNLLLKPLDLDRLSEALERYLPAARSKPPMPVAGAELPLKLRTLFVESSTRDLRTLADAVRDAQSAAVLDQVHALKGVLLMMGERNLGDRFGDVEARLREGAPVPESELQDLLQSLAVTVDAYRHGLKA